MKAIIDFFTPKQPLELRFTVDNAAIDARIAALTDEEWERYANDAPARDAFVQELARELVTYEVVRNR